MNQLQSYEICERTYTSLLEKAVFHHQIQMTQYQDIKKQIEAKAFALVKEYLHGRSSSISITLYQRFMKSILFTLDHALPNNHQIKFLIQTKVADAYAIGNRNIVAIMKKTEALYDLLKQQKCPFYNERYLSVFDQILRFLKSYDTIFYAYRCVEDLDYPLLDGIPLYHDMYHKKGCDLVYEYVSRLAIENRFIQRFQDELSKLIFSYEQTKGMSIAFLGCSLCEIVFYQFLFHLMIPEQTSLLFEEGTHDFLCQRIYAMQVETIWEYMQENMIKTLSNEEYTYLLKGKNEFIRKLQIAKDAHEVAHMILYEQRDTFLRFSTKEACDPTIYQKLLQQLNRTDDIHQKAEFIRGCELGFYDYIDLFEANIFIREEYEEIYMHMQDIQLVTLFAYVAQDMINFHQCTTLSIKELRQLPCQSEWESSFYEYMGSLSQSHKQTLIEMLAKVSINFS